MSKQTKNSPKFTTEAQEQVFWESSDTGRDPADDLEGSKARKNTLPNLRPTTQTIFLRLPQHLLDSIQTAANARDFPY